jgi:Phosphopantetheine attachment site
VRLCGDRLAVKMGERSKVDRKALPEPGKDRPELGVAYVLPRTTLESKLAEIWAGVLQVDAVGVEDNFFDLGGHSLAGVSRPTRFGTRDK